jgi:hypothetical protein
VAIHKDVNKKLLIVLGVTTLVFSHFDSSNVDWSLRDVSIGQSASPDWVGASSESLWPSD